MPLTTGLSASLGLQAEVKRGIIHTAPQAPPYGGGEAPALGPEFFTDDTEVMERNDDDE